VEARRPALASRTRRANAVHRLGPVVFVSLAVVFGLVALRGELAPAHNLNDGAVHRSMIGWAEDRWSDGHLPLDGWYPQLALGSSRFHRYQSLPHVLTGLLAIPIDSHRAYTLTLYLGLSLWPIAVFAGGRLLGLGRWRSAAAALVSPLIASAPTLGYEWGSYAWRGYGTWTQLWGMWVLPFAWGFGYRAVSRGRSYAVAALVIALTVAVHLLTGYLALLSLGLLVIVRPTRFVQRIGRAALVGFGALLVAAWVVVPLLLDRATTIQDEFSRGKVFYDSFGARQILSWMVTGQLFDRDRIPVISIAAAVGLCVSLWRWRRDERVRVVVSLGLLSLLLFFGRTTWGSTLRILPGSGDLFLRRYVFGVHLAGLYLAGIGLALIGRVVAARLRRRRWPFAWRFVRPVATSVRAIALVSLVGLGVFAPAWAERWSWAAVGARWIQEQRDADRTDGADVAALVAIAERRGPGRIYGGLRSNWGAAYRVGQVPVYAELLNLDAEAVGFTRPTWSLASPAEFRFRDSDPAHFDVFDVRYLIQPATRPPPVDAELVVERGRHALWEIAVDGAMEVVDTGTPIEADRTNLGSKIAPWLSSDLPEADVYPGIAFGGFAPPDATVADDEIRESAPGTVLGVSLRLGEGRASATVEVSRPAAVILEASFDNRWRVTVDGQEVEPQMFAPGIVGRLVPPGRHEVAFEYVPFPRYDLLLAIGVVTFLALVFVPRRLARGTPRARTTEAPSDREPERVA
jgi:hypothetical protein